MGSRNLVLAAALIGLLGACDSKPQNVQEARENLQQERQEAAQKIEEAKQQAAEDLEKSRQSAAEDISKAQQSGTEEINKAEAELSQVISESQRNVQEARRDLNQPQPQQQTQPPIEREPASINTNQVTPEYCQGLMQDGVSEAEREQYQACESAGH